MNEMPNIQENNFADDDMGGVSISEMLQSLREHLKMLTLAPLAAGLLALGITTFMTPTFTAVTTLMPPQQSQSGAESAPASLGALAGLAGDPTKGADSTGIFVVRSNRQVISGRQRSGNSWWGDSGRIGEVKSDPGGTVFVPEEVSKTTFIQSAKDWTQILYQFGIGLAGIKSALN